MDESLGNFLLEKRFKNKGKMQKGLKTKYIGDWGELFVANYLYELFEANNIKNVDIEPHNFSNEKYDLYAYVNNEKYVIEVKTSREEKYPDFKAIHFNNDFNYLLLVWSPNDEKVYLAILTKEEAKEIATPMNKDREDEDNWQIYAPEYFDENNENFLKRLAMFLGINKELEDLTEERKLELVYGLKEEIMKNPDAVKNDFNGETYQQWIYEYLSNFTNDVEAKPRRDEYDIKYKGKHIEIKYSSWNVKGFKFEAIKPDLFDFIFFIGFDEKENKFYFSIKTSEEIVEIKKETAGTDNFYSENGFTLVVGKHSILNFVNDFYFEDFNNYIESH